MDPSTPDRALADELIVIQCQLGERSGFDALIERWHEPVGRYVRRLLGDDPSTGDVAQDVWLRVFRGIAGLREPGRFGAWLFSIARRAVMDHLRVKYATGPEVAVDVADLPDVPDEEGSDHDRDLDSLEVALGSLPVIEREVLALFYLRELSLLELADVLEIPVGTVKSRLHRARKLLRRQLDHQENHA